MQSKYTRPFAAQTPSVRSKRAAPLARASSEQEEAPAGSGSVTVTQPTSNRVPTGHPLRVSRLGRPGMHRS
ncbi:MAG: hypothetical protein ACRDJO_07360, partial [Actinomycetota bacterium]